MTPSKQTATQLKGRQKDEEAAANTLRISSQRTWRRPTFGAASSDGKEYGTAMHALMQYIPFSACADREMLDREIEDLISRGLLEEEQTLRIDRDSVTAFFATELGQKLCNEENVLREFKFSILDDASRYGDGLQGEQVLLQGVVDCVLIEDDGITIVDFKTDRVSEKTLHQTVERYRPQVQAYARAMERIYEKPVKRTVLYFFHIGKIVEV